MELTEPEIKREEVLILQDDDFRKENVCIVTGSASGIGRATAIACALNGITTVGLDVDVEEGTRTCEIAKKLGGEVFFIKCDLTKDEDMDKAVEEASNLGNVKFLANIAGIQHIDLIENFPMEKYDLMHKIMLRAPFYLSKLVIRQIKKSTSGTGVIGNMASLHAHICTSHKPAYNIMKFGLRGLTQSIAAEGEGKIRAFSVSTGFVKTPLALKQVPAQAAQRGITPEQVVTEVMLGRSRIKEMMTPIEVGNLFVFGFSRFSRYLIGGDLLFDGGCLLTY